MPPTVQDILNIIEKIAPASLAESWDNVGLMIGNHSDRVQSILLGLDPTLPLLDEAVSLGSNLLITHHPAIFHPLRSVTLDHPDGRFLSSALSRKMNVISCHTNLDAAHGGVSDCLAGRLGLTDIQPLSCEDSHDTRTGLGRTGNFSEPVSPDDFIRRLKKACDPPWILTAGPQPEKIDRAAVCGGSCSELAESAMQAGAQVFVTAEVKHSVARWAEEAGMWVIDAGHFATENPAMSRLAHSLSRQADQQFPGLEIRVTERQASSLLLA
jgi:dinuclear metal center YbgI/SA1388 family protein